MGFYSWECAYCDLEILAPYPYSKYSEAVVLFKNGAILKGEYDGYGRIDGVEFEDVFGEDPEMYHLHCWEKVGSPTKFTKSSEYAKNQGYFVDPKDYDGLEIECEED